MTPEDIEDDLARSFDRMRGMCLGMLESFGLEERHERAICSTFKSFTYDRQADLLEKIQEYLNQ